MKKTIKITSILLMTLAVLALTGCYGSNMGGPGKNGRGNDKDFSRLADKLDLTKAQEKSLDTIKDDVRDKADEMRQESKKLHKESVSLIDKDSLTEQEVLTVFGKFKAIFDKNESFFAKKIVEAHSILTKEQRSQIKDLID